MAVLLDDRPDRAFGVDRFQVQGKLFFGWPFGAGEKPGRPILRAGGQEKRVSVEGIEFEVRDDDLPALFAFHPVHQQECRFGIGR